MGRGILRGLLTGVPLVDERHFHRITGDLLHLSRQLCHLRPILAICGHDMQRQQLAQGLDGQMHLAAAFTFRAIIPGACATLRCGLEHAAIQDGSGWVFLAPIRQSQQHASVMHNAFEHLGLQPALGLLVHRFPRRQVVGQPPPRDTHPGDPAQGIEDFPQGMPTLGSCCGHQRHIRGDIRRDCHR
jgi:hypothetical protein